MNQDRKLGPAGALVFVIVLMGIVYTTALTVMAATSGAPLWAIIIMAAVPVLLGWASVNIIRSTR